MASEKEISGDATGSVSFYSQSSEESDRARAPSIPDYLLLRALGKGTFGTVWLASSKQLGILRAIKILQRDALGDMELQALRNYALFSRSHPNLIEILHVGEAEGSIYYVMELADACRTQAPADPAKVYEALTLRRLLIQRGALPLKEAAAICRDVLTGLAQLHKNGLLHRDVKPDNVVFVEGVPKLTDISLLAPQWGPRLQGSTPRYAPPGGVTDAAGDLFCLGRMLLELVAGEVFLLGSGPPSGAGAAASQDLERLRPLLERACHQDPSRRFGKCEEFENALSEALGETSRIGPYRLIKVLGKGGMGVVHLAERREPMRQWVAIKLILPGMDSEDVLRRFDAERQALALLRHPNIAAIMDAGSTADGRPYFVLEYVPGVPITKYCEQHCLGLRERLELFLQVCGGVEHAHANGLIHRDLKPANVLVTHAEGKPLVKIIDFGLAKAMDRRLTEKTLVTLVAVGTPPYLSPEQASPGSGEVDQRSDVYSLGMLLYELLAGELPMEEEVLNKAALEEVVRRILEEESPAPSTRLGRLNPDRTEKIAFRRGLDRARLVEELRGDLDDITMFALEKEHDLRCPSVKELARLISLYLEDRPVPVRRRGALYRLRKFIRRHRLPVAAATSVFLTLILGLVVSLFFLRLAVRNARIAEERADLLIEANHLREVESLEKEEPQLRPNGSAMVEPLENWLRRVEFLLGQLPRSRDRLRALQTLEGRPPGPEEGEANLEARRDGAPGERRARLAELTGRLERLQRVNGPVADVRRRLKFSREVRERTILSRPAEWQACIGRLRASGIDLEPQEGLIPLGPDPASRCEEFAHLETGDPATRKPDGTLSISEATGLVFVFLPPGALVLGGREAPAAGVGRTAPSSREVKLDAFFVSKYEMTQGQWLRASGRNPALYSPGGAPILPPEMARSPQDADATLLHPVERVSWTESQELLARLGLFLPTEAQWEYAARAGTTTPWWTGETKDTLRGAANLADRFAKRAVPAGTDWSFEESLDDKYIFHAPVGRFKANGFGLHDIIGNVWEWCLDAWCPEMDAYPVRAGTGERLVPPPVLRRVMKGGSFIDSADTGKIARREEGGTEFSDFMVGLRPVRHLTHQQP